MAKRLQGMGTPQYRNGFEVTLQPKALEAPLGWPKPQMIFVNSMSDLFHDQVPDEYIKAIFDIMRRAHWHTFQILTKRAERLADLASQLDWAPNIWMGVSIESDAYVSRARDLAGTGAAIKFLSCEPLLGPLPSLDLSGINWVIVGGESGPGARPMAESWVLQIKDKCADQDVPFFFKQWGGVFKKKAGRLLQGRTWDDMPRVHGVSA